MNERLIWWSLIEIDSEIETFYLKSYKIYIHRTNQHAQTEHEEWMNERTYKWMHSFTNATRITH